MSKPRSRRSSARLNATTRGVISLGKFASGSRIEVAPGPIVAAFCDTSARGLKALRMASTPTTKVAMTSNGMIHPRSTTNFMQQGLNQDVGVGSARHRYGNRAGRAAHDERQAIVLAALGAKVLETKIARVVRPHRPFCCDRS